MEKIVAKPTWKEILIEQIKTKKIDPWDVDIAKLSSAFLEEVKKMEELNLSIPANIILASSILLKYKSEVLRPREVYVPEEPIDDFTPLEEIPTLEMVPRIPPKIPITLNDIIKEIEKVIKYDLNPLRKKKKKEISIIEFKLEGIDMEEEIKKTFNRIISTIDSEGWTTFRSIAKGDKREIVLNLLSLLYLYKDNKIILKQDSIFGEIFIKVPSSSGQG